MKKSELQQIIREEIRKVLNESPKLKGALSMRDLQDRNLEIKFESFLGEGLTKTDMEWREVSSLFQNAMDEIQKHDQYAYADAEEVNSIALDLINNLQKHFDINL